MESFYGGVNGKSFEIRKIFANRLELEADLLLAWNSPVAVGEFVLISYGMPNEEDWKSNSEADLREYKSTYNSTLWLKHYNEATEGRNADGLYYELIASMSGYTPRIQVAEKVLNANEEPTISIDLSIVDSPVITFGLPQSEKWTVNSRYLDSAESLPVITMDKTNPNKPTVMVEMPRSFVWSVEEVEVLSPQKEPTVELIKADYNSETDEGPTAKFKFSLPQAERLKVQLGNTLEPGATPTLDYDDTTDPNYPLLTLNLPTSKTITVADIVKELGPSESPTVEDTGNAWNTELSFSLPRAVKFYYGELLGKAENYSSVNVGTEYKLGDYYINITTGRIYEVTGDQGNYTYDFTYRACLQAPEPTVEVVGQSPYELGADGSYVVKEPTVAQITSDVDNSWKLTFGLPRAATPQLDYSFIGVDEEGSMSVAASGTDTIKFTVALPRGTKIFSGNEVDINNLSTIVEGAKIGDLYLNTTETGTSSGHIFRWNGTTWEDTGESLKGPIGETVKIYDDYEITQEYSMVESEVIAYLEQELGADYEYSPDELFKVRWIDTSTEPDTTTDYYFYKTVKGAWGCSQITGGVESLLQKEYMSTGSDVRAYTVTYINDLIGSASNKTADKDRKAYSINETDAAITSVADAINTKIDSLAVTACDEPGSDTQYYTTSYINEMMSVFNTSIGFLQQEIVELRAQVEGTWTNTLIEEGN